jgi:hypothetical protein
MVESNVFKLLRKPFFMPVKVVVSRVFGLWVINHASKTLSGLRGKDFLRVSPKTLCKMWSLSSLLHSSCESLQYEQESDLRLLLHVLAVL